METKIIDIDKKLCVLDPNNPRTSFEDGEIESLTESIETQGQLEAVTVEQLSKKQFMITEGHKRLAAIMKSKKVNTIRAVVEDKLTPEQKLMKQITIDIHRNNWSVADRDKAWKRLWDMGKYTPQSFATKISISLTTAISFVDRMSLGNDFIKKIDNVSALNIMETKKIADVKTRKKVLEYCHKEELTRKNIRELATVSQKVSSKVLNEVLSNKITIADASNMIGLNSDDQDRALISTKGLNKHKKNLKKMIKKGDIKDDNTQKIIQEIGRAHV